MAKQVGPFYISGGTVSDLTFYKMDGQYYVRQKSSLSRKRVLKDPKFKKTMENAGVLAKASRIASKLYRLLDKQTRNRSVYNKLTGMAMGMLKAGCEPEEVVSHFTTAPESPQCITKRREENAEVQSTPTTLRLFVP